jgi:hypothetical protein
MQHTHHIITNPNTGTDRRQNSGNHSSLNPTLLLLWHSSSIISKQPQCASKHPIPWLCIGIMPKAPIRQVFRYWKPTGVLSTTLPCKDGQNILQHSPPLARYLAEATANGVVVPIGRLVSANDELVVVVV